MKEFFKKWIESVREKGFLEREKVVEFLKKPSSASRKQSLQESAKPS